MENNGVRLRSQYEWDHSKALTNALKHGIAFEEAVTVLQSDTAIVLAESSNFEERFIAIGFSVMARVLVIVFCYRGEEIVRIISARKATKREREQYEKGI